jgi:O-acetyl-ADP-ribose deacetylase
MPAISSGILGFPKDRCAKILIGESKKFLGEGMNKSIQTIEFCIFDDETLDYFISEFHS